MRRRTTRGFSLLEALCALLILGVGLVGMVEAMTLALRSGKDAERHTQAALLAAGRMEELRGLSTLSTGEEEGDFGDTFPAYAWQQYVEETSYDGLYEVTVTVTETASDTPVYELTTLIFRRPYSSDLYYDPLELDGQGTNERGGVYGGRR